MMMMKMHYDSRWKKKLPVKNLLNFFRGSAIAVLSSNLVLEFCEFRGFRFRFRFSFVLSPVRGQPKCEAEDSCSAHYISHAIQYARASSEEFVHMCTLLYIYGAFCE